MYVAADILPHLPALRRRSLRLCRGDRAWADDLVSATVVRTLEVFEVIREDLGRFMMRVAFMKHKNWYRRRDTQFISYDGIMDLDDPNDLSILADPHSPRAESIVDLERVLALLDCLPDAYRQALTEVAVHGREYREVAQELNINLNTLKSRLTDARTMLRDLVEGNPVRRRQSKLAPDGVSVRA